MEDEVRPLLIVDQSPTTTSTSQVTPMVGTVLPWNPRRAQKSGILILISVTLERFAYYAVVMNLFLYLNRGQPEVFLTQSWEPVQALTAVYIINGVSCVCSPIGGWFSDSLVGRYWAIIFGTLLYIVGYSLLTALSLNGLTAIGCDWQPEKNSSSLCLTTGVLGLETQSCAVHVYVILVLIGFGVGFLRANVPPFGAEQVRSGGDYAVRQFFNAYYWCANIGSLLGIGILAYVEQNVENGFFFSYLTATTALVASLIFFSAGRFYYLVHRPGSSVVFNTFRIIGEGVYNTCKRQDSIQGSPMFRRESHPRLVPVALTPSWIDRAKVSFGGSFHDTTVEDVKQLAKNLVFISVLLPYWLVYFQMSTSFQAQGLHMRVHLNETFSPDFEVPSAWLTLFDQVFILLLIPLLNFFIYPFLDRKEVSLSPLCRMIIGMIISLFAVLAAAVVEHLRLQQWQHGESVIQIISNTVYNASAMPITYQIPQYCFIGAAEVFAGVAGLEYAYTPAPRSFQGIIMGLYAAVEGMGSFLGVLLVQLTRSLNLGWIRNEGHFNQGHLDYFFYLLAIIQLIVIIVLVLVTYLRWEPPRRPADIEETLGASALHTEFYRPAEVTDCAAPP